MQEETKGSFSRLFRLYLPFRTNTECDDFFDYLFLLEDGCFLHGDFAEGVDVHACVGEVDVVVLDFDLIGCGGTFWAE